MGSLPPVLGAPAPPAPAAPTLPSDSMVLWIYLDEAQRHELHAGIRKADPLEFFVREVDRGVLDPTAAHEWRFPIQGTWESRTHHLALEERLTLLGRYQRNSVGTSGWKRVAQNVAGKRLLLDPLECSGAFGAVRVHYYGSRESARSALVVESPSFEADGERVRLVRLAYEFPDASTGEAVVVHERLTPLLARSALAAMHLELVEAGLEKVASVDRATEANAAWWAHLDQAVRVALGARVTAEASRIRWAP